MLTEYQMALSPHKTEYWHGDIVYDLRERTPLVRKYSWAIPSKLVLRYIARFKVVEVMAGAGYWAYELNKMGVDIVAFDKEPYNQLFTDGVTWFDVKPGTHEILISYSDRALFMCWPPYGTGAALEHLKAYRGSDLLYVGEMRGCCADEGFFDEIEANWNEVDSLRIPQFLGINDRFWHFKRKTSERP